MKEMKINHVSLTRKWIVFSLVLLSPEILAAETLNFNYKRADTLSLEPRLGLQARACHSKADPMEIIIGFNKGMNITKPYKVMLDISGSAYTKSYAVFSSSAKKRAGTDPDFLVPWSAYAKGTAKVSESNSVYIPEVPEQNGDPFCFSNGGPRFYSIIYPPKYSYHGLLPIFKNQPYYFDPLGQLGAQDFEDKCKASYDYLNSLPPGFRNDIKLYWPYGTDMWEKRLIKYTDIAKKTGSFWIQDGIERVGEPFLFVEKSANIFFSTRTAYQPPRTEIHTAQQDNNLDENCTASSCHFNVLAGKGGAGNLIQDGGAFLVKLNNRNISALTLTLVYDKTTYIWKWQQDSSSLIRNRLYLANSTGGGGKVLPTAIDMTDPYKDFYKNETPGFYRGTLVNDSSLKMDSYNNYIEKIIPLSLPANKQGDINLVNTESLMFTLGAGSDGAPTLGIFGQPLKFAPLTVNGKEAASAMQVRNACY
ncbi:hypothetical protein GJ179_11430 [Salmonella enterica subsp. enterica]|nr:hypothetical protein [Salmonella enterica]EEI1253432.1 hypothetical protein [Salmonella enterica subsp. enterica]EEL2516796.1 hypothetical protein [Salmonella enterica]EEO4172574.1 hypothetical protein [Salmonella enterica subsp. enterica]EIO8741084.1 hypothetical protein [Salmonella enterica]